MTKRKTKKDPSKKVTKSVMKKRVRLREEKTGAQFTQKLNFGLTPPKSVMWIDPTSGKKPPWGSEAKTVMAVISSRTSVTTDSYGYAAFLVYPGCLYEQTGIGIHTAGGVVSSWSPMTSCSNYSSIANNFSGFRVASAQVIFRYVHNDYENEGTLAMKKHIHPMGMAPFNVSYTPTSRSSVTQHARYGTLKEGGCAFPVPADEISVREFMKPSTTTSAAERFEAVSGFIVGGHHSTIIGELEIIQNVELHSLVTGIISELGTASRPLNTPSMEAGAKVYEAFQSAGKLIGQGTSIISTINDMVTSYAGLIMPTVAVMNRIAQPNYQDRKSVV